ncbi:UDPGP type 1 family protein [Opitutales bacterium ASA1]|nr:UDPGP type 1 family protein [Opitutales bacterium ASA1]
MVCRAGFPLMNDHNAIIRQFERAGQGQVFRFWSRLDDAQRARLVEQAREIDLDEIRRLDETLVKASGAAHLDLSTLEPAPYIALPAHGGDEVAWVEAKLAGEKALREGKVAAFTVAGGQGTRLGFDGPKGTFPVTPVTRKPLFAVFAEKIRAAQRKYGCEMLWFVMTSHANHEQTVAFFEANGFFGLRAEQVQFFRQGRMPAVDFDGKILLESADTIALSPDGHGGSLRALVRSGAVERMERAGVEVLSYFQVDNPLVHCIDAAFIGFHFLRGSEMSSRMVPKAYDKEKVGHFCVQDGRIVVVEYSDMPDALATLRDDKGELVYRAGSIAIHLLSTAFVRRLGEGASGIVLPFHRADKKVPCAGEDGATVKPEKPNGIKFEMFVFDALPFAANPIVVETRRDEEFSPVKNAEGVDSPETCRNDQMKLFTRWMHAAGLPVKTDENGVPTIGLEVSPLFAIDEDTFAESWAKLSPKPELADGLVLE